MPIKLVYVIDCDWLSQMAQHQGSVLTRSRKNQSAGDQQPYLPPHCRSEFKKKVSKVKKVWKTKKRGIFWPLEGSPLAKHSVFASNLRTEDLTKEHPIDEEPASVADFRMYSTEIAHNFRTRSRTLTGTFCPNRFPSSFGWSYRNVDQTYDWKYEKALAESRRRERKLQRDYLAYIGHVFGSFSCPIEDLMLSYTPQIVSRSIWMYCL